MSTVYLVHCIDTEGPLDEYAYGHALGDRRYQPIELDAVALERDLWGEDHPPSHPNLGVLGADRRDAAAPARRRTSAGA